jgi:hypothetical protein
MSKLALFSLIALLTGAVRPTEQKKEDTGHKHGSGVVDIQISNVNLQMDPGITLQIRTARGRLEPTSTERPVTLD